MRRTICRECKQVIRRPADHYGCPGVYDNWFLDTQKYIPKNREITKEIKIPKDLSK